MQPTEGRLAANGADVRRDWGRIALHLLPGAVAAALLVAWNPWLTLGSVLAVAAFLLSASERRARMALFALAAYAPFEELALKVAPPELYLVGRFGPYGFLALVLAALWVRRLLEGRPLWRRTPIDLPLALFLVVATASWALSDVPLSAALVALQPLLRFLPLVFYLLQFADFDIGDVRLLKNLLLVVLFVEALTGLSQSVLGQPAWTFFAPRAVEVLGHEVGGTTQVLHGGRYQIFGTVGRYNQFGALMGLALVLSIPFFQRARARRWAFWVLYAAFVPALVLAASRAAWIAALVSGWSVLALRRQLSAVVTAAILAVGVLLGIDAALDRSKFVGREEATGLERMLEPLSADYLETAFNRGRLYYLVRFPAELISEGPREALLGYGPGSLGRRSMTMFGIYTLDRLRVERGLQPLVVDVQWAYLLGQVGLLGLGCFVWMLIRLARSALRLRRASAEPALRDLADAFLAVLIFFAVAGFFSPMWEFRSISLYFWLIAGVLVRLSGDAGAAARAAGKGDS